MTPFAELVEHVKDSAMVVLIMPESIEDLDEKLARETGLAAFLDKPIIVMVREGTPLPSKLLAVADRVVTVRKGALGAEAQQALQDAVDSLVGHMLGRQS